MQAWQQARRQQAGTWEQSDAAACWVLSVACLGACCSPVPLPGTSQSRRRSESCCLNTEPLPAPLPPTSAPARPCAGGAGASRQPLVRAIAWDPRGQRLAVALGGAHPAAGSAALFDTRCDPILTARFIGFLSLAPLPGSQPSRGPFAAGGGRAGAAAEAGWEEIQPEEVAEAAGAVGGGAGAPAAARRGGGHPAAGAPAGAENRPQLAFLPGFRQGAVLAARLGDRVAAIPMYYA